MENKTINWFKDFSYQAKREGGERALLLHLFLTTWEMLRCNQAHISRSEVKRSWKPKEQKKKGVPPWISKRTEIKLVFSTLFSPKLRLDPGLGNSFSWPKIKTSSRCVLTMALRSTCALVCCISSCCTFGKIDESAPLQKRNSFPKTELKIDQSMPNLEEDVKAIGLICSKSLMQRKESDCKGSSSQGAHDFSSHLLVILPNFSRSGWSIRHECQPEGRFFFYFLNIAARWIQSFLRHGRKN